MKKADKMLWEGVDENNLRKVALALNLGADADSKGSYKQKPLHWASIHGYTDIAKLLIEAGADLNAKDNIGRTSLHWASWNGYTEIVKLLIEAGADVRVEDNQGNTLLHYANSEEMRVLIEQHGATF